MLKENTLFGVRDKIAESITLLREHESHDGYYLAFSGGKDSIVIKQLAIEAGVKFDAHYSVTTIDPPDLVYYIRKHHPDVIFEHPEKPFLIKLVEKGFPLRQARWCCELYKERGGDGRWVMTGIRWEESSARGKRHAVEPDNRNKKLGFVHPIINWASDEVWQFIRERKLPYCRLYDEGWTRIGCIACPFASSHIRRRELDRYPGIENAFRRAFRILWEKGENENRKWKGRWSSGDDMFEWWLKGK